MDRQEVIAELRKYQEQFTHSMQNMAKNSVAMINDKQRAEETRLSAIANAPDGALDGKNEGERKLRLELLLANDEAYKKHLGFVQQDEWEIAQDQANVDIAKMGVRVLETIAKLLVEG